MKKKEKNMPSDEINNKILSQILRGSKVNLSTRRKLFGSKKWLSVHDERIASC